MLTTVLWRTATRPHSVTPMILTRSKGSTSVPPLHKGSKPALSSKVHSSKQSSSKTPKTQATSAEATTARTSVTEPASPNKQQPSATPESSTTPTNPPPHKITGVTALPGVRTDSAERQWHATVVHGRGVLEAYRHPRTHGIPVATIQFRAHSVEPTQLAAHFASHAAASLGIPLSGVVSLPTRRTLWTVPRGPFAHKKSQENFERRVHARAIKAFDADAEVVDRWVRYLEAHALPGVGMRVVRWHRLSVGIGRSHLQSVVGRMRLGRVTNKQKVKELGDKIVEVESKVANQPCP